MNEKMVGCREVSTLCSRMPIPMSLRWSDLIVSVCQSEYRDCRLTVDVGMGRLEKYHGSCGSGLRPGGNGEKVDDNIFMIFYFDIEPCWRRCGGDASDVGVDADASVATDVDSTL